MSFTKTNTLKALAVVGGLTIATAGFTPSVQAQYRYDHGKHDHWNNKHHNHHGHHNQKRGMARMSIAAPKTKVFANQVIDLNAYAIGYQGFKLELQPSWYVSHGAYIDSHGQFRAHAPGHYTVTAKFYNQRQGRWYVDKINIQVVRKHQQYGFRSVKISPYADKIRVNESINFDLYAYKHRGQGQKVRARWSTSRGATINHRGVFYASHPGTYTVVGYFYDEHNHRWLRASQQVRVYGRQYHHNNHDYKYNDYNDKHRDWNKNRDWNKHNYKHGHNQHHHGHAKVDFTRWETGKGNFFEPWAKVEGKVYGKHVHKVVLYRITKSGHWRELTSAHVKDGSSFSLHKRYSIFDTDSIGIRVYGKHGKILREAHR